MKKNKHEIISIYFNPKCWKSRHFNGQSETVINEQPHMHERRRTGRVLPRTVPPSPASPRCPSGSSGTGGTCAHGAAPTCVRLGAAGARSLRGQRAAPGVCARRARAARLRAAAVCRDHAVTALEASGHLRWVGGGLGGFIQARLRACEGAKSAGLGAGGAATL